MSGAVANYYQDTFHANATQSWSHADDPGMNLGGVMPGLNGMKRNMVMLRPHLLLKTTQTTKIFRTHRKQRRKLKLWLSKLRGRGPKLNAPLQERSRLRPTPTWLFRRRLLLQMWRRPQLPTQRKALWKGQADVLV